MDNQMNIPKHHEQELLRCFQRAYNLNPDGIYGPKTAAVLGWRISYTSSRMRSAYDSAVADIGKGESPRGSNGGPYVENLRHETGLSRKGGGEWCAVFLSAHLQRAGIDVGSRGAPGLVRLMKALPGGREVSIDAITPGFVGLALRRRGLTSHHVQIFTMRKSTGGNIICHVGGNEKHEVRSTIWSPAKFFKGVKKVVTYE